MILWFISVVLAFVSVVLIFFINLVWKIRFRLHGVVAIFKDRYCFGNWDGWVIIFYAYCTFRVKLEISESDVEKFYRCKKIWERCDPILPTRRLGTRLSQWGLIGPKLWWLSMGVVMAARPLAGRQRDVSPLAPQWNLNSLSRGKKLKSGTRRPKMHFNC